MSRFWKIFLFVLFVLLVLEIVVFAPNTLDLRTASYDSFEEMEEGGVQQKLQGLHLIESRQESKEWEVWGKEAVSYRADDTWQIKSIKILFFSEKGDHYTVLGKRGKILANKNIEIEGAISIRSMNGYKFTTEKLLYNSELKLLTTKDPIKMLGPLSDGTPTIKITGVGMQGNLSESLLVIQGDVLAEKRYNGNPVYIKSKQVELSGINYMSKFINNVVIDSDTLRITGSVAGVGLSPKDGAISTILVEGNVKVSDNEKWATAHQLEADFLKNKFIFKGSPRVVQNEDELTGDEIIFLDGGKRVKVLRARVKVNKDKLEN